MKIIHVSRETVSAGARARKQAIGKSSEAKLAHEAMSRLIALEIKKRNAEYRAAASVKRKEEVSHGA